MTDDNIQAALRAFAKRKPFRPYLIEFMSGDRLEIHHPEAAAYRVQIIVYVGPAGERRLFDESSVCQFLDKPAAQS
ncbi:MAG: hypothetical protein L0215_19955 [Gemmataceae bacterium]|nr:hypothetical protein [Gemmataceae bacterium]